MKTRTRTIFIACFAIATFNNFTTSVEVSSNVDLDSKENEEILSDKTFNTIVNLNGPAYPSEPVLRTSKPSIVNWRHENELVKSSPREPRKRRIYSQHDDSTKRLKIINNIQIVINSNGSVPSGDSCKHGVCNVSVSSKPDEEGNIISEVHLSIITNAKPNVKIDDIPVIDSFRGISEISEEQPTFKSRNIPNLIYSHLYRGSIPEIQINRKEYGGPYQHRRTLQRPQTYWNYQNFENGGNTGFHGYKIWPRERPVIDDKIAPPLSNTKSNDMYINS